jgi:hypothetical protein
VERGGRGRVEREQGRGHPSDMQDDDLRRMTSCTHILGFQPDGCAGLEGGAHSAGLRDPLRGKKGVGRGEESDKGVSG